MNKVYNMVQVNCEILPSTRIKPLLKKTAGAMLDTLRHEYKSGRKTTISVHCSFNRRQHCK